MLHIVVLSLVARQAPQIPSANLAGLELIAARPRPMRFQTQVALVSILQQSRDLSLPIDRPRPQRSPYRRHALPYGSPSHAHARSGPAATLDSPPEKDSLRIHTHSPDPKPPLSSECFKQSSTRRVSSPVAILQACSFSSPIIKPCPAAFSVSPPSSRSTSSRHASGSPFARKKTPG